MRNVLQRVAPTSKHGELEVEHAIPRRGMLGLKQGDCHVVHRNTGGRLAIKSAVVGVPVNHQICAMPVDHLSQSRSPHERKYLWSLTANRPGDRRIMQDNDALLGPQL